MQHGREEPQGKQKRTGWKVMKGEILGLTSLHGDEQGACCPDLDKKLIQSCEEAILAEPAHCVTLSQPTDDSLQLPVLVID